MGRAVEAAMELLSVPIDKPDDLNLILGQSHYERRVRSHAPEHRRVRRAGSCCWGASLGSGSAYAGSFGVRPGNESSPAPPVLDVLTSGFVGPQDRTFTEGPPRWRGRLQSWAFVCSMPAGLALVLLAGSATHALPSTS
jgi:hypothetical protein